MSKENIKLYYLSIVSLAFIIFSIGFVIALNCWTYTSSSTCTLSNGCNWRNDSWGSWCEEASCWSLFNQSSCTTTNIPGKNCSWTNGTEHYSCTEVSCWGFSGTNNNSCISNYANKSCTWSGECYTVNYVSGVNCYGISNEATCKNTTGCGWGQCRDKGCTGYATQASCKAGIDWEGNNCTWSSSGSYCRENNCWDLSIYPNKTTCESAKGISCEWKWERCQEKSCYSFDFTNQTACVNNTIGKSCKWDNSYCKTDDCWNSDIEASCTLKTNCRWRNWNSSGQCEEVDCWKWDSWRNGSQSLCENNEYGFKCVWSTSGEGNTTGYCWRDVTTLGCKNITTEKACFDTFYCWWQANDWKDSTKGGNCTTPTWGTGDFVDINSSILNEWNPGCYILDTNSTKCNSVIGCNYTGGLCKNKNDVNGTAINAKGISCYQINDSALCNNIASLSNCCAWQNSSCTENRQSRTCFNQLAQTPNGEKACEDAENSASCDKIAGDPWYMPCKWNNSTAKCDFKVSDVFGNSSQSLLTIENQRNCEAAGGKWIIENYCEGSVSVPTGRCEYKFDDEENCDKACFACEIKDSDRNRVNSTNAKDACTGSKLGYCEFNLDTSAPNGIGYCKAKEQWKKGLANNCNSVCGDCTFLGDSQSNSSSDSAGNCLAPACFCTASKANSAGGGCKWLIDNSTANKGYCVNKGEKTCLDSCDRCKTREKCANEGRSALNSSGSCKWEGTDNDGSCISNIGDDVEVCWDGADNNNNGLIDCGDPSCYSDTWCGFVEGDCFGWTTKSKCESNSCEWVNDTWNPAGWCDFKGGQCWRYDNSESECLGDMTVINETLNISSARISAGNINQSKTFQLGNLGANWMSGSVNMTNKSGTIIGSGNFTIDNTRQTINFTNSTYMVSGGGSNDIYYVSYRFFANKSSNCEWNNGTGSGWCERDWSIAEQCFNMNESQCYTNSNCDWTNDTWCDGFGKGSDWCNTKSGWCDHRDFKPKSCWQKYDNSSCSTTTGCSWKIDTWSQPHCEVNWTTSCWDYNTQSTCENTGCWWRNETFGGINSAWCGNNFDRCWSQTTKASCNSVSQVSCNWRDYGEEAELASPHVLILPLQAVALPFLDVCGRLKMDGVKSSNPIHAII